MLPVVPEAQEASQQYEALHTALHQFVEATHAEWYNGLEGSFAPALANSLLLQDKNQGGLLVMNFDKQLLKMLQEVCAPVHTSCYTELLQDTLCVQPLCCSSCLPWKKLCSCAVTRLAGGCRKEQTC